MVAGALVALVAIAGIVIFRNQIGEFVANIFTRPLFAAGESIQEGFEDVGGSIFDAGAGLGKQFAEFQEKENIKQAERQIEQEAKDAGFSSLEELEKATDTCRLVVGGDRKLCDVGLIGVDDTQLKPRFGGTQKKFFGRRQR